MLRGKGANLAEMANLGLPVPPGFTITTEVCTYYCANGKKLPEALHTDVQAAVATIGESSARRARPLPATPPRATSGSTASSW